MVISLFLNKSRFIGRHEDTTYMLSSRRVNVNKKAPTMVIFINERIAYEHRWEIFVYAIDPITSKNLTYCIIYTVRIHETPNYDPIIQFVTAFKVNHPLRRLPTSMHERYKQLKVKHGTHISTQNIIFNELEDIAMEFYYYPDSNQKRVITMTKDDLLSLNEYQLSNIEPMENDIDAKELYLDALLTINDRFAPFLDKYNPDENGVDELYHYKYFYFDMNGENFKRLNEYNHTNVDIFNELYDQFLNTCPNRISPYESLDDWKLGANAVDAITHGYTQGEIFKALIECFGKEAVMPVWKKHYIKFADMNNLWRK